jgi:hypothetical protein
MRRLIVAMALVGSASLAWAAASGGASAGVAAGPRLAVVLSRAEAPRESEVVTVGPDGEDPRRLARGTIGSPVEYFEHPNWSSDGKLLAFQSEGEETPVVALLRADGSDPRLLRSSEHPGGPDDAALPEPLFDPKSGELIVAVAHTPNGEGLFGPEDRPTGKRDRIRIELWELSTDGRRARRLSSRTLGRKRPLIPFPSSIAADGTVAASAVTRRGFAVVTIDPRTGATRTVVPTTTQAEGSLEPAISPDGREIVYKVDKGKGPAGEGGLVSTDLFIVPTAGGRPRLLARIAGGARWPSWDPSGSRIAFTALNAAGEIDYPAGAPGSSLMEINPDGTCLTQVFSLGEKGAVQGAAWQPGPERGVGPLSC